jgi:hypothetical protein
MIQKSIMDYKNWDRIINELIFSYNTLPHRVTGISPYEAVFGRVPCIPIDRKLIEDWSDSSNTIEELQDKIRLITEKILANRNAMNQKSSEKESIKNRRTIDDVSVGDYVRVLKENQDNMGKLTKKWKGPFIVIRKEGKNVAVRNVNNLGDLLIIHQNNVKLQFRKSDPNLEHSGITIIKEEGIEEMKIIDGVDYYLVRWNIGCSSWEEEKNIIRKELIEKFTREEEMEEDTTNVQPRYQFRKTPKRLMASKRNDMKKQKYGEFNIPYEIDYIMDKYEDENGVQYKLKFKGFSHRHDRWFKVEDLPNCSDLIADYERTRS